MAEQFWLGVLTPFAVAAVVAVVAYAAAGVSQWWATWRPRTYRDADKRADLAAALAVAHRVAVIRMPGGFILVYRARVDRFWRVDYQQALGSVRDALENIEEVVDRG